MLERERERWKRRFPPLALGTRPSSTRCRSLQVPLTKVYGIPSVKTLLVAHFHGGSDQNVPIPDGRLSHADDNQRTDGAAPAVGNPKPITVTYGLGSHGGLPQGAIGQLGAAHIPQRRVGNPPQDRICMFALRVTMRTRLPQKAYTANVCLDEADGAGGGAKTPKYGLGGARPTWRRTCARSYKGLLHELFFPNGTQRGPTEAPSPNIPHRKTPLPPARNDDCSRVLAKTGARARDVGPSAVARHGGLRTLRGPHPGWHLQFEQGGPDSKRC